jgi:SNF2 family DNA or RNA helicase
VLTRLHSILRPFLLRRLKKDVEKQLPDKVEHVLYCPLSRRQQYLYDEFLEKRSNPDDNLGIMNVLMYLRKVCNHPDLFAPREVQSPLTLPTVEASDLIPRCFFLDREIDSKPLLIASQSLGRIEGQR